MKQCRRCLQTKPSAEFSHHPQSRDRLQSYCRVCSNAVAGAWHKGKYEPIPRARAIVVERRIDPTGRVCMRCEVFKPWSSFWNHPTGINGRMARCTSCANLNRPLIQNRQKPYDENGRVCLKCDTYKPWESFRKHNHGVNGRDTRCYDCKPLVRTYNPDGRTCKACKRFLPWSKFGTRVHSLHGKSAQCFECVRAGKRRRVKPQNNDNAHQSAIS